MAVNAGRAVTPREARAATQSDRLQVNEPWRWRLIRLTLSREDARALADHRAGGECDVREFAVCEEDSVEAS